MTRVKTKADRLGVETVGMYIGGRSSNLVKYVGKLVSVRSSRDLPTALMDMVRGQL